MTTPIPDSILRLIDRFQQYKDQYQAADYKEFPIRQEFIDPFFAALGWDMDNTGGYGSESREVILEDSIKIGEMVKAPDYAFRIGGERKFFVEAKKPAVSIRDSKTAAFQLRRYGWSASLPFSVLTDFAEFAVYDCRVEPRKDDPATKARILYFTLDQYAEKWPEIAALFSKEAVLGGALEKYAEENKAPRGAMTVDAAFLKVIEGWREKLAKNIAAFRADLSPRQLNYAVQMTLDRIIFLRYCEDRGIEPYGSLLALTNTAQPYPLLVNKFKQADARYNSGLFHFEDERGRTGKDTFTPTLYIDPEPLKAIIKNLYYPDSPYAFSVIPIEILGQVYEQFLGRVIVTKTDSVRGLQVDVVEKPEVRKAGGVFYTPPYIVDYIVRQTLSPLLDGKTPEQARQLRVLDPACGSGSFLIGAYQFLLEWHKNWYVADGAEKHPDCVYQTVGKNEWRLTIAERKRIVLNMLYGVDIDPQAVETTKLSLLLRVLENETDETIRAALRRPNQRALPDLDNNIKCGNSLIGYDYRPEPPLTDAESERVNRFDWQTEFPAVFAAGGFDAIIGNPPYIRIQTLQEFAPREVDFYKGAFVSAAKGNYDIYVAFVERGLALLNGRGRLGYILPHKFFNAQYGEPLRGVLAAGKHLAGVVHFGDQQIFKGATTYTCLLFLEKGGREAFPFARVADLTDWRTTGRAELGEIPAATVTDKVWNFTVNRHKGVVDRLSKMPVNLQSIAHIFVGLQTDGDDIFIVEEVENQSNKTLCFSKATNQHHLFEADHLKPFLKGSLNIHRYHLGSLNKRLIFPYEIKNGKATLIGFDEYQARYPLTWDYLQANMQRLSQRGKGKLGNSWYGYVYKKNHTRFGIPKIVVPSIATGSCFAPDLEGKYYFVGSGGGGGGGYGITLNPDVQISYHYLLGLLNSGVSSFFLRQTSTPFQGGYLALNRQYIEKLPVVVPDLAKPAERKQHDQVVGLVDEMLRLQNKRAATVTPEDLTRLEREIAAVDRQIDAAVYALYGLSDAEIRTVEG